MHQKTCSVCLATIKPLYHYQTAIFRLVQIETNSRQHFNPFSNDKVLDETKLKAFANDKQTKKNNIFVFDRVENIVGQGENAGNQHFLLFPQCFQKPCFQGTSKGVVLWEWFKIHLK